MGKRKVRDTSDPESLLARHFNDVARDEEGNLLINGELAFIKRMKGNTIVQDVESSTIKDLLKQTGRNKATVYVFDEQELVEEVSYSAKRPKYDPTQWIRASDTRNYALDNCLDDWLDLYHKVPSHGHKDDVSYLDYIMEQGHRFEARVIELLKERLGDNKIVTVCAGMTDYAERVYDYAEGTLEEMRKGTPIIYQGVLLDHDNRVSGTPDLLVRGDYLAKIVDLDPEIAEVALSKYHVVDIKWSSLHLCSDGLRVQNSGNVPAYKCQLQVYNQLLKKAQGYEPETAFLLGRRWNYETRGEVFSGNSCFDRLGHVQFQGWDHDYIAKTQAALSWLRECREKGGSWSLLPKPSHPLLYPNIGSSGESPYHNFKLSYAKQINDLSLLWNVGSKRRQIAHAKGIFSYKNRRCTAEMLGVKGDSQGPILDKILAINRQRTQLIKIHPNLTVDNQWRDNTSLRIFVDFETVNNLEDLDSLPHSRDISYLFMIGVAHQDPTGKVTYRNFILEELTPESQLELIEDFYEYLRELTDEHLGEDSDIPNLYHWGHFERTFFDSLCERLDHDSAWLISQELHWYDLLDAFRGNPIVVNGCFKFGLKEIAGRLHELGLISTSWDPDNPCRNGNMAMMLAYRYYQSKKRSKTLMRHIAEYNEVDCKVLAEIVSLLRGIKK